MKKIFIIFRNFDDYESQSYAIGFVDSKESAEAVCRKLDGYQRISKEAGERAIEIAKPFYDEELNLESPSNWPKWKEGISQKDITVEMRAERDAIKEKNKKIEDRNRIKSNERRERIENAVDEFINGLDYNEEIVEYVKKMVSKTGGCSYLLPYTYQEIKKLT